mgnify:CR=1 FL=1
MRKFLIPLGLICAVLAGTPSFAATEFPQRPVRLMVGFAPGGIVDEMARTLARAWGAELGQSVVVENRPGASSMIAAETVAKAEPDGYTLMFGTTSMVIANHMQRRAGQSRTVDPLADLVPVGGVAASSLAVAVTPSFPASDMKGFIEEVRSHPDTYFYATSGVGSLHHLGAEMLMDALDMKMTHVPYKGASQILPDLISGQQIKVAVVSPAASRDQAEAGKVRLVGLLAGPRLASMPDVPSFSEVVPDFDAAVSRMFVLAPVGTPQAAIERLSTTLQAALRNPELIKSFGIADAVPAFQPASGLAALIERENAYWGKAVSTVDLGAK